MNNSALKPLSASGVELEKSNGQRSTWVSWIFRLKLEELLALLFLGPMVFYTFRAYFFFKSQGNIPKMFISDIEKVLGIMVVVVVAHLIIKVRPRWILLSLGLPFAYCLAIYTNLHDTIPFINPKDIHFALIRIDQLLFGIQPSVWAQQFIRPWLTELFSFCYWFYFILIPLGAVVLYFQKRMPQAREVMISTVLCLFAGYILYVIFPAISPSVILRDIYTVNLRGTPLTDFTMNIAGTLPLNVRDAFPSLHAGIALLSLLFAWKYLKWLFWIILPICFGLVLSTIYLRHHYFIDIPPGFILGFLAFKYGGPIDAWWNARNPESAK